MRVAMSRMAAGLRGSVAVMAVLAAAIGAPALASPRWVVPVLAVICGWTALYVWLCWTRYLRAWMIAVDVAIACAVSLSIGELVPPAVVNHGYWVAGFASIVVICAQLMGRPFLSIPAGFLVAASLTTGARLAGSPSLISGLVIAVQACAAAATMVVATRTGRAAADAFTRLQEEDRRRDIGSAARADMRAQLRLVHNGPLTTLMMALHAPSAHPSPVLRRHAASDLRELFALAADLSEAQERLVRLDRRLEEAISWHRPELAVSADLPPIEVPATVAEAFAQAVKEALTNVTRHTTAGRARLDLGERDGRVHVGVFDQGPGFDTRAGGFGVREVIIGTMIAAGGVATVQSTPGEGTTVRLEWRREP
ncbi:ATP-binding protein [Acrocarpospora sp. B8E8]|uniref:sensor histidine kinase n=1 Tax=Acrocarpospora sp. B8E8 TaxID=3153572 RepID=UPI00325E73F3